MEARRCRQCGATMDQCRGHEWSNEPPGTVLLGSINRGCYLFLCQTAERMKIERANARQSGIQDPIDFVFELDGRRHELSYEQLVGLLTAPQRKR